MEYAERLLSTRRGSTVVGVAAAVLAGLLLLVYLNKYRSSVAEGSQQVTVLMAKRLIQKGTPGAIVGSEAMFQPTEVRKSQLQEGAISDVGSLRGQAAVDDIYPGQQLTATDFAPTPVDAIGNKLTRELRAIGVPLDTAHGLIGNLKPGDHVDVYAALSIDRGTGAEPFVKLIVPNTLVLRAPAEARAAAGAVAATVVVRATYEQAAEVAFAAENGKIWVALRPSANARPSRPALVTVESLLFGVKPVAFYRKTRANYGASE